MRSIILSLAVMFMVLGCENSQNFEAIAGDKMSKNDNKLETATFAGGCFWCTESDFEKVEGVVDVISGYSGGHKENPTYQEVGYSERSRRA